MNNYEFEQYIQESYKTGNRSKLWLAVNVSCEAAELAELIVKEEGYNREYTDEQVLSEAGDVINFVTALLHKHGLTLSEAMDNNIVKLKTRGWIK